MGHNGHSHVIPKKNFDNSFMSLSSRTYTDGLMLVKILLKWSAMRITPVCSFVQARDNKGMDEVQH